MSRPVTDKVKVAVVATDPTGATVAFEASGWEAAHKVRGIVESYYNRLYGWRYVQTIRLVNQREVRS